MWMSLETHNIEKALTKSCSYRLCTKAAYNLIPKKCEKIVDMQVFYAQPRLVAHIDGKAIASLTEYYKKEIGAKSDILDICSSWISHFPEDFPKVCLDTYVYVHVCTYTYIYVYTCMYMFMFM